MSDVKNMKADLKKGFEKYDVSSNEGPAIAYMGALADVADILKCSGIPEYERMGHELGQLSRRNLCMKQGEEVRENVYVCNSVGPTECRYQILAADDETGDGSVEILCIEDKEECPNPCPITEKEIKNDQEKKKAEVEEDGDFDLF